MRLHHLDDEEIIALDQRVVMQPAFEIGVALGNSRRADLAPLLRGQTEAANLSISAPVVLPIFTTVSVSAVVGRLMTHSRLLRISSKL